MRVNLSAEGAENVCWPWLYQLRGWGSVTMAFLGRFGHGQETLRTNLIVQRFFMAPGSFVGSIWKKHHFLQKAKRLTTVLHLPVFSMFFS